MRFAAGILLFVHAVFSMNVTTTADAIPGSSSRSDHLDGHADIYVETGKGSFEYLIPNLKSGDTSEAMPYDLKIIIGPDLTHFNAHASLLSRFSAFLKRAFRKKTSSDLTLRFPNLVDPVPM